MAESTPPNSIPDHDPADDRPIVLVPLDHERKGLLAHLSNPDFDLEVCGPGTEGIRRWAGAHTQLKRPVVLAGLGGGLDPELATGTVRFASEVYDPHGKPRTAPLASLIIAPDLEQGRFTSSLRTVGTVEAKADLRRVSGADIVDLESVPFAQLGERLGWKWGIIRAVGDTADEPLPAAVDNWVDHQGRTSRRAMGRDLFRRPNLITHLRRRKEHARVGLQALGQALNELRFVHPTLRDNTEPTTAANVLIFGGSFDPPHRMHATMPFDVAKRTGCNQVMFVPAKVNPLKTETPPAPAEARLEMLRRALADAPPATISRCEIDREEPSWMVDTLLALRTELKAEHGLRPNLRLLIGSDQVLGFKRWHQWRKILDLATPAVVLRPPLNRLQFARQVAEHFEPALARQWVSWVVDLPQSAANSSDLRQRIARQEDTDDCLAPAVRAYIDEHGLYR